MRSAASAFQPSSCVHRATGMPSIVVRSGPRTGAPQGRVVTAQTSAKGRPALRPLRLGFSGSKNPGSRSSSYRCSLTSAAVHAGSGVQRQAATACGHWATGAPLSGCSTLRGQRPGVKVHAGEAVASSSGEFNAPARPDTLWYSRYDKGDRRNHVCALVEGCCFFPCVRLDLQRVLWTRTWAIRMHAQIGRAHI